MHAEDLLLTLAQVAVTFVGFSALALLFQTSRDGLLDDEDKFSVRMLIENGLQAALYAIIPHLFYSFGLSGNTLWRLASGLVAATATGFFRLNCRRVAANRRSVSPIDVIFLMTGPLVVVMLTLNAAAIGFPGVAGPYVLAVVWMLVVAAYPFLRVIGGQRR